MGVLTLVRSIACLAGLDIALFRKEELIIIFMTNCPNVTKIEERIKIDTSSVNISVVKQKEKM